MLGPVGRLVDVGVPGQLVSRVRARDDVEDPGEVGDGARHRAGVVGRPRQRHHAAGALHAVGAAEVAGPRRSTARRAKPVCVPIAKPAMLAATATAEPPEEPSDDFDG